MSQASFHPLSGGRNARPSFPRQDNKKKDGRTRREPTAALRSHSCWAWTDTDPNCRDAERQRSAAGERGVFFLMLASKSHSGLMKPKERSQSPPQTRQTYGVLPTCQRNDPPLTQYRAKRKRRSNVWLPKQREEVVVTSTTGRESEPETDIQVGSADASSCLACCGSVVGASAT